MNRKTDEREIYVRCSIRFVLALPMAAWMMCAQSNPRVEMFASALGRVRIGSRPTEALPEGSDSQAKSHSSD